MLNTFGKEGEPIPFPNNLLADFAGGGTFGVVGILMALLHREKTGQGQQVDVAMHEAVGYLGSFVHVMQKNGSWNNPRGFNMLDGGAPFYRTYKTKDNLFMAVGSIEPKFYQNLLKGLGLDTQKQEEYLLKHLNFDEYPKMQLEFEKLFLQKSQQEWTQIFDKLDCCVTPVLHVNDLQNHPHWAARKQMTQDNQYWRAPQMSNIKQDQINLQMPERGGDYKRVLKQYGISENEYQTPKL